jgi:hypothetical protein
MDVDRGGRSGHGVGSFGRNRNCPFPREWPETRAVIFSMDPPPERTFSNEFGSIAPSPDGRYVVFAAAGKTGGPSLWLRPLDSLAPRPLPGTEGGNFPT